MAAVSAGIIRPVQIPQATTPTPSDKTPDAWLINTKPTAPKPPDSTAVLRAPKRSAASGAIRVARIKLMSGSAPMMPIMSGESSSSARIGGTNKPKAKRASPKLMAIRAAPRRANEVLEGNFMSPPAGYCKFTAALHSVWQRCHQEVHQRPHLGRNKLAGGINRIHPQLGRAVFRQQLHQPARVQIVTQQEARLVHHPLVSHRGGATGVTVIGVHPRAYPDRKSTRLNSSHVRISYAVFCLKKKRH